MKIKSFTAGLLLTVFTAFTGAQAQTAPPSATPPDAAVQYANKLHLAYVRSTSSLINNDCQRGLEALSQELVKRTSVTPHGVVGLDLEKDDILFFPFIYWPVTPDSPPLSEKAQKKLQNYIDNGGMILLDGNSQFMDRAMKNITIRPLAKVTGEHTMTRSYYLAPALQGSTTLGSVWSEVAGGERESVTSVIIGDKNWAAAWAGRTTLPTSKEHEMALRSGINFVMFALCGNYKADQHHVEFILERLGK